MITLSSCLIWQIISFILPPIDLQKMTILAKKKIIFSDGVHFDLGMLTSKIVAFGAQKTRTHTLKSQHIQNESEFGTDFGPDALANFSLKKSEERPLSH